MFRTQQRNCLRRNAARRKVAGSMPEEVTEFHQFTESF
jgi:hypothetical protein